MISKTDSSKPTAPGQTYLQTDTTEATVPQSKDNIDGSESRTPVKPISHRAVSHPEETSGLAASDTFKPTTSSQESTALDNMESPCGADEITINDPEFNQPPGKIKKLALAIKIFSKSFKTIYQVNHPETDRSQMVERIRSKVYTVACLLSNPLNYLQASALSAAVCIGGFILLSTVSEGALAVVLAAPVITIIGFAIGLGAYFLGSFLFHKASDFITSAVSAIVDTREKSTETTTLTLPKDRFLNKYQRMEESLLSLRTKLFAAECADINYRIRFFKKYGSKDKLEAETQKLVDLDEARRKAGIPDPCTKLLESLQYLCLRDEYGCNTEKLKEAIHKTEDWLNRAAKQKELLTEERRKLEELYNEGTQPIGGGLDIDPKFWVSA
ncbi:hypothetical protein [Endozoicomonas sp. ONNA2]|uniref:hypothetical protein n=1 Tax=Endozoicomonas sp. ONNA2 TaxID=2828741 RepID=UPI00214994CE|nr:hypothetical protein [Endozoicomonas sp. ONNA2]